MYSAAAGKLRRHASYFYYLPLYQPPPRGVYFTRHRASLLFLSFVRTDFNTEPIVKETLKLESQSVP